MHFKNMKPQGNMLEFCGVHVIAELIGGCPQGAPLLFELLLRLPLAMSLHPKTDWAINLSILSYIRTGDDPYV